MANQPLNAKSLKNFGVYGVIRQNEVADALIPDGAVVEAVNVNFDRKGAVQLRSGITSLGSTIVAQTNGTCLGLFNALFSTSGSNALLAVFSNGATNSIHRYNSTDSSWYVSLAGDTSGNKTRFLTFGDRAIRIQGGTGSLKVWKGDSHAWDTSGTPINPDKAPPGQSIERFKGKIYIAGDLLFPDRVYYSETINSSGYFTWSNLVNFFDVEPNDGENLTGIKRFSLELWLFKPNYIYRFKSSGLDVHPLIKVGTRSNESIIEGKKGLYFHHDSGFYQSTGGMPQEISRPISDIVDAIPLSYRSHISSWKDSDHICWSVGDLTVDGSSWTNVVCRYTESSQLWTVYSYAKEFRWGADYNNGTTITQVAGDDAGGVFTLNSGTDDAGTAIAYRMITKWNDFGSIMEQKVIQQLAGICEKAQGSELMYQVDDSYTWKTLGNIKQFITDFEPLSITFHRIRFKLTGMSSKEAFVFLGVEISKMFSEGLINKR